MTPQQLGIKTAAEVGSSRSVIPWGMGLGAGLMALPHLLDIAASRRLGRGVASRIGSLAGRFTGQRDSILQQAQKLRQTVRGTRSIRKTDPLAHAGRSRYDDMGPWWTDLSDADATAMLRARNAAAAPGDARRGIDYLRREHQWPLENNANRAFAGLGALGVGGGTALGMDQLMSKQQQ